MKMKSGMLLLLSFIFAIAGCGSSKSPSETTAVHFLEAYYVDADLQKAASYTDGFALDKVQQSLKLREGQEISKGTHHPKISFKQIEAHPQDVEATYVYRVTVRPEKAAALEDNVMIKVRQRDAGVWKVTQFSDHAE